MLADGETEDVILAGELETVALRVLDVPLFGLDVSRNIHGCVVGQDLLLLELKLLELGGLEHFARAWQRGLAGWRDN